MRTAGAESSGRRLSIAGRRAHYWAFIAGAVLLGLLETANVALAIHQASLTWTGWDWNIMVRAGSEISSGINPYAALDPNNGSSVYRWSPVAAWLAVPIGWLGVALWRVAHLAALALIRPRWVALVVGTSFPFWFDFTLGNVMTFAFVLAWLGIRGSNRAGAAYLVLFLLVPKPVMAPVALWILWQRRNLWLPFAAALFLVAVFSLASGYLFEWLGVLTSSSSEMQSAGNYWPSYYLGYLWVVGGVPLAILLVARGRLGLASLLASPYYLPYYLMFGFLELQREPVRTRSTGTRIHDEEAPGWTPARSARLRFLPILGVRLRR